MKKLYNLFAVTVALVAIVFSAVLLYADVSPTAAVDYVTPTVQAVSPAPVASPSFWTYITQLPLLLQVFGSSFFASLLLYVAHFRGWLGTAQGKAELSDFAKAVPALEAMAADAGHPLSAQAQGVITQAIALAPKIATAFLIGFLTLAGTAKAGTMELGVPLSPTAGAAYVEETWITMPTLFDITRQGDFTWSATFYVGAQTTWQWGPNYGLGVTLGGNVIGTGTIAGVNGVPVAGHVCGGLVGNFQTVEVGLLYDDKGLHCGISKSW